MNTADWINVVALTPARELVLIEQYRHGTARPTLEIPGGMVDAADASPADAARRELLEETGYAAERMIQIGVVDPNPAIQGNRCYTFLAEGAERVAEPRLDPHEEIDIRLEPAARAHELVRTGAITHALVVVAFHWWALHEGRP